MNEQNGSFREIKKNLKQMYCINGFSKRFVKENIVFY